MPKQRNNLSVASHMLRVLILISRSRARVLGVVCIVERHPSYIALARQLRLAVSPLGHSAAACEIPSPHGCAWSSSKAHNQELAIERL